MGSYEDPDLGVVIEFEYRFCVSRKHLVDVVLPNHEPPLELVERPGAGPNNLTIFDVRTLDTRRRRNLDSILLCWLADQVAAARIAGLENIKLPGMDGYMSDTEWSFTFVPNPATLDIRSIYRGCKWSPVGSDDGLKRCLRITTARLASTNLGSLKSVPGFLLRFLDDSRKSTTFHCWANDTCDAAVHIEIFREKVRLSISLETYQNLLAIWGIYEKEIERFHFPYRRHPQNAGAISLRFGDGGPADRHPDMRDDTRLGRAAFARDVYATQSMTELHNLVHSSLAQGNRKVDIPSSHTPESPASRVSFRELAGTMMWGMVSSWCDFVCCMVRYAHWLAHMDFSFFLEGVADIDDLLELINVERKARKSFRDAVKKHENKEAELPGPSARTPDLEESSQGGPRDIPPEHWIRRELEEFNALGVFRNSSGHNTLAQGQRPLEAPDLTGDIHPLFYKGAWNSIRRDNDDWTSTGDGNARQRESLRQVCLLASRLLEAATPWFASLLPQAGPGTTVTTDSSTPTIEVPVVKDPSPHTLEDVRRSLREMGESVKISFSPELMAEKGIWSENRRQVASAVLPLNLDSKIHASEDEAEIDTGHRVRRQIQITIAAQLRQAALSAKPGTEEHLFAVFYLAVVLVSRLADAAWQSDFNNLIHANVRLGNDVLPDLGKSLQGWIFGGWFPLPNRLGNDDDRDDKDGNYDRYYHVKDGLHWNKLFKRQMGWPRYDTLYSIPVQYIQRVLTQSRWGDVDRAGPAGAGAGAAARELLRPDTPFQQRHTARRILEDQSVDELADWGEGIRKARHYEDLDWEITPPPEWDLMELRATGAVGCTVSPLSLTENVHPVFALENWTRAPENLENTGAQGTSSLTRKDYARLEPAMRLASLLLKVGAPWFTSFLPQIKFVSVSPIAEAMKVSPPRSYSVDELAAARAGLENMAGYVRFDHNALQLLEDDQLGLCSRGYRSASDNDGNYKYRACDQEEHHRLDVAEEAKNLPYRRIQISVSSQVIRAILDSAPQSEKYLQATYSLATTLTHELAHAALYVNFEWNINERDPALRGEAQAGLGNSLFSWLHTGWVLCNNTALDEHGAATFRHGASWRKWHRVLLRDEYVPRYRTYYSIQMSYIQRLFMQVEWNKFDLDNTPDLAANGLLRPTWPFRKRQHARRVEKTSYEFWSTRGGDEEWYEGVRPVDDDDRVPYYVDEDIEEESRPT